MEGLLDDIDFSILVINDLIRVVSEQYNGLVNCLIIGLGAAGKRHFNILNNLGYNVWTVSKSNPISQNNFHELEILLEKVSISYIVVSNTTSLHQETLLSLVELGYSGKILLEKPSCISTNSLLVHNDLQLSVGYNLRFHAAINWLRSFYLLNNENINYVNIHYGNRLTNWRSYDAHRDSYSRYKKLGGGVLRDFSHEIDYANWIFSLNKIISSKISRVEDLTVDSEDKACFKIISETGIPIEFELNYLELVPRREIQIGLSTGTLRIDILNSTVESDEKTWNLTQNMENTYYEMHKAFIGNDYSKLATLENGIAVDQIIVNLENLNSSGKLI